MYKKGGRHQKTEFGKKGAWRSGGSKTRRSPLHKALMYTNENLCNHIKRKNTISRLSQLQLPAYFFNKTCGSVFCFDISWHVKTLNCLSETASCPLQMAGDILLSYMIQHSLCVYSR